MFSGTFNYLCPVDPYVLLTCYGDHAAAHTKFYPDDFGQVASAWLAVLGLNHEDITHRNCVTVFQYLLEVMDLH